MSGTLEIPNYGPGLLVSAGDGRSLDVLRDARDLGRQNLPRSDERAPGGTQKWILEHFRGEQREFERRARATIDELVRRCHAEDAFSTPDALAAIWDGVDFDIQRTKLETRDALVAARRHERRAMRQLSWFRRHHQLSREADYPASALLQAGLLASLVLVESLANMYFFALGSDFGLIGGLIQALAISLVNVGLAVVVGFACLRNLVHRAGWRRGLAGVGLGLFVSFTFSFNLMVGHYRDLFAGDSEAALVHVLPRVREAPFDLTPHSLLLFAVGVIAAGLGLAKGFSLDDAYPGYGRVDRRYRDAERGYTSAVGVVRPRIFEALEHAQRACDARLHEARARAAQASGAILEMDETVRRFAAGLEAIQTECQRALRAYREENAQVRTMPPPAYFDDYPRFEGALPLPARDDLERQAAQRQQRAQSLESTVADYRARLVKRLELEARGLDAFLGELADAVRDELQNEA